MEQGREWELCASLILSEVSVCKWLCQIISNVNSWYESLLTEPHPLSETLLISCFTMYTMLHWRTVNRNWIAFFFFFCSYVCVLFQRVCVDSEFCVKRSLKFGVTDRHEHLDLLVELTHWGAVKGFWVHQINSASALTLITDHWNKSVCTRVKIQFT